MEKRALKKLLFLIVFMSGNFIFAQTVKGKVTSGGFSLPGVSVIVEGTKNGTNTDFAGEFILNNVPSGSNIVFSYVGFKTVTLPASSSMDVVMLEDAQKLEEVVVIGYGTTKRKDITGAVSSVKASEIQDKPFASIDQALIGKAAGVNVTQNSGTPGGGISVQIRGITSINGNEPLYVIDGTPVFADRNNETFGFGAIGGGNGQTRNSALSNLNISDIESIDILKDASATAIYGANGANGVVLITTKKGKKGKSTVSYETYGGMQQVTNFVDMLTLPDFARYQATLYQLDGAPVPFQYQRPDLLGQGTDWQRELFQTAYMYNHQLSFSGGSEDTRYFTSLSYFDQEGTVPNSNFERLSLRLNIDTKVKPWLKIGNNISFSKITQQVVRNDDRGGVIMNTLRQSPELPVFNTDGSFAGPINNVGTSNNEASNPIALAEFQNATLDKYKFNGNLFADFSLHKNLTFRTELGYDINFSRNKLFLPTYQLGNVSEAVNKSFKTLDQSIYWNVKNYFTYNKTFNDKHNLTVLLGQEAQQNKFEFLSGSRFNFDSNLFDNLSLGDPTTATNANGTGTWAMESFISRVNYSFDDRYSLSASLRADASSNFGPNNKWGYFPAFSGAWTISNEQFLTGSTFLNYLKFKLGYGSVGNQNIPPNVYQFGLLNAIPSPFGGNAYVPVGQANPDVKWEALESFNIGYELELLQGKIKIDYDYYIKRSSDFLTRNINNESNQSAGNLFINIGEIETKGFDYSLNTRNITTENFSWDSTIIFSTYDNKLVKFQGEGKSLLGRVQFNNFTVTRTTEGQPVGQFYGFLTDGLFRDAAELAAGPIQETGTAVGDIRFKDINGDGRIDNNDLTVIGSPIPDFTYAITNNFKYKNFDLSVVLQGSQGNDIYNFTKRYTYGASTNFNDRFSNVSVDVLNAFVPGSNENTNFPRIALNDPNGNIDKSSDRFIEDGSYLRIQNISFGYNFPSNVFGTSIFTKARVYANVQNLYTFTKYSGLDPAVGSLDQSVILNGIDMGRYPVPRIVSVGLNLEF